MVAAEHVLKQLLHVLHHLYRRMRAPSLAEPLPILAEQLELLDRGQEKFGLFEELQLLLPKHSDYLDGHEVAALVVVIMHPVLAVPP